MKGEISTNINKYKNKSRNKEKITEENRAQTGTAKNKHRMKYIG